MLFVLALAVAGGLAVGSFLNVVAWRLPRGESLASPPSRCPSCAAPIRPYDNVPVVSWLVLRGRCRACATPISRRYPIVEALTGVLYGACLLRFGADTDVILPLVFVTLLVAVTLIDLDHRIIPNVLVGPAALVAVAGAAVIDASSLTERLVAAAAAGGFLLLAALAYPGGMGMGDVKLAGAIGLFVGRSVGPAMLAALVAGTLVGLTVIARHGAAKGRKTAIPFGPFLALGGLVGLFAGDALIDWYASSFAA
ncbi:MAG: prepilin peptidase [Actinomycetota bacterium]|nr:prepilin peptidase [Actinomycetota bacterium]